MQRNVGLKIVGALLMIGGIIAIIIGAVYLTKIEKQAAYISGDYIVRSIKGENLAAQKTPCYITIGFGVASAILGLILLVVKTKAKVIVQTNAPYRSVVTLTCPSCRAVISAGSVFCNHCGYNLSAVNPEKSCPICGYANANDSLFCERCGGKLN